MNPTREQILDAAFGLIAGTFQFVTKSRRFRARAQVDTLEMPALFSFEPGDTYDRQSENLPFVTLEVMYFLYFDSSMDPNQVPASWLNNLLDKIDDAFAPTGADGIQGKQTLGGLVSHCYIDGDVVKNSGEIDGKGAALIPIRILVATATE